MRASILAFAAVAQLAAAHTTVYSIEVNGKTQGLGNVQGGYIDSPPSNDPVKDVTSKAMECNVANIKATRSVAVNGGDDITVEWHHNSADAGDDILDPSHKGPISVYLSKAGSTLSWTKIAEDGYDGMWATDKMIQGKYTGKKGQHKFTLPKVAPGEYVIRPELIGLHEGDRVGGAQFYQECIHVKVGGSGTTALPAGVAIPGHVTAQDAGVLFNIYGGFTSYPIPGPKLWNGAGAAAPPAATTTKAAAPAATTTKAVVAAPTTTKAAAAPTKAATTLATVAKPAPTAVAGGATAQKYAQCGGQGYTGATACASGSKCTVQNQWYSQCL